MIRNNTQGKDMSAARNEVRVIDSLCVPMRVCDIERTLDMPAGTLKSILTRLRRADVIERVKFGTYKLTDI